MQKYLRDKTNTASDKDTIHPQMIKGLPLETVENLLDYII